MFWLEIIASIFGNTLSVHPNYQNGTSFGSALCAMVATKRYPSLEDAIKAIPFTPIRIKAHMRKHEAYMQYYDLYKKMYQSLKPLYSQLYRLNKSFEEKNS